LRGITVRERYVQLGFARTPQQELQTLTFYLEGSEPFFQHFYATLAATWTVIMGRQFPFAEMENNPQLPAILFADDSAKQAATAERQTNAAAHPTRGRPSPKRR
jgi:hypothetical protein